MNRTYTIIGAGGHGKVVVAALLALGKDDLRVYDDDPNTWGKKLLGIPVAGSTAEAAAQARGAAILAIGDNRSRAEMAGRLELDWISVVHPTAVVHSSVLLGPGSVVCAGAVIQPGTRIGRHVIVNTSASVDHDCDIADFVHVGPGARVAGDVRLGSGTLAGVGSAIAPNIAVGEWAAIGAGAAVIEDLPDRCTAVGVPARVLEKTR